MTWTTPKELKAQLARLWERGELLRDAVTGNNRFPLRLTLKGPSSAEITDRFDAVRKWAAELQDVRPLKVEWQEVRHRIQGAQKLPGSVWIDSMDDAIDWLGKRRDWNRFSALAELTGRQFPELLSWLEKRPRDALELADEWPRLLSVVDWVVRHPRPGIYLRQADIPSVHSKFIETHRKVLGELLDLVLPAESVDATMTGVSRFAARYGFLEKPARIRFRILDPEIGLIQGLSCPDVTLDSASFGRLTAAIRRVFITENETNFLAFPKVPGAIVIFGAGYGWDALAEARWLDRCEIRYWGDIDTHGFAILDQLRGYFSHVESIFMDRATLDAHQELWGREDKPQRADLLRLDEDEARLYDDLRDNRIREGLRLEQEHLGFEWVCEKIELISREMEGQISAEGRKCFHRTSSESR